MTEKKADILLELRNTLRFHQAMGIHTYPKSEDVMRFLETIHKPKGKTAEQPAKVQGRQTASARFDTIEEEINSCALCQLSIDSLGRVQGKGSVGCRLMIVGDWSSQSGTFSSEIMFGKEEDDMLWKMISAMGLQINQVYVTNCLKCCPKDSGKINTTCEESCFSFLAREIAAVNPLVVCAMGDMAARVVMGRKDPLTRLRGKFGDYRYSSSSSVAIMPTFHPRFLLQHQEMKKATWNDLQAIMRRLGES